MTAGEVAELAVQNHQQLKVSAQNIDIAKQNINVKTSETSYHYGFYKSVLFRDAVANR
jgi:hypothetical protein